MEARLSKDPLQRLKNEYKRNITAADTYRQRDLLYKMNNWSHTQSGLTVTDKNNRSRDDHLQTLMDEQAREMKVVQDEMDMEETSNEDEADPADSEYERLM